MINKFIGDWEDLEFDDEDEEVVEDEASDKTQNG